MQNAEITECSCRRPAKNRSCGLCHIPVCKDCEKLLADDAFLYAPVLPEGAGHSRYCIECFEQKIEPQLATYSETLELAKNITHVSVNYRRPLPTIKEANNDILVEDCVDRQEAILKLGFMAALGGYNSIIRTKVESKKIRNHAYQTSSWSACARAANLRLEHFDQE